MVLHLCCTSCTNEASLHARQRSQAVEHFAARDADAEWTCQHLQPVAVDLAETRIAGLACTSCTTRCIRLCTSASC